MTSVAAGRSFTALPGNYSNLSFRANHRQADEEFYSSIAPDEFKRLWLRVLSRALKDLFFNKPWESGEPTHPLKLVRCREDARLWFRSDRHDINSFITICNILDIDPGSIRRRLSRYIYIRETWIGGGVVIIKLQGYLEPTPSDMPDEYWQRVIVRYDFDKAEELIRRLDLKK